VTFVPLWFINKIYYVYIMVTNTRPNQLSTTPNINPDLLRQVEKEDFLPPISPWISIGGLVIVATFGITVALAAVSQYNITVKTTGTVRPAGELKVVQAPIEGIVKRIEVKENQLVKKGAPIVYLDDSQLQIQKAQLEGNIKLDKSQLTEINNQINSLNAQMVAEQNVTARTVATARAELSRNERDYQDWLVRTNSEIAEAESAVKFAQTEMEAFSGLAKEGAVSRLQAQQKNQIFIAAKQRLQRAQAVADPSAATIAIAKERIVQEQARGQVTIATLEKERSQLLQRRTEIESQLRRGAKDIQQIAVNLNRTVIRASTDGTIINLSLRNASQVLRPGEPITQIVPQQAPLIIKARVPASDISNVTICKQAKVADCKQGKVQLRFSAYPFPDFGSLRGAVRSISADAITSENGNATAPFYEVTIQPEKQFLKDNPKNPIQSGMDATVDIISREETALTFVLRKARWIADI
jgi:HlyD family type I secretion membrane fusion protein